MLLIKPGIQAHPTELVWYLTTHQSTYVIGVDIKTKTVLNLYWGPRLLTLNDVELPVKLPRERSSQDPAITSAPEEFPVFGGLRYGPDVLRIEFDNGTRELDLIYTDAIINDSQELIITLKDKVHKSLEVRLHYKLDVKNNLILRHTVLENLAKITENESFRISKAQTAAWHIPPPPLGRQRELVTLAGAWSSETQVQKHSIQPGTSHLLQSTRGIPSAQVYPYFAIRDPDINETYFGTLGWSGNWEIEIHTDIENQTTITGGMHDRDFGFILSQDHPSLELPVFVAGFTSEGLSGARLSLTNHIRDSKNTDGKKKEAFGFQVGYANQKKMAEKAAALGIELFVVDDGWFHGRHSDKAGLGDWFVDKLKFPLGLRPLADHVHNLGMQFGLWFEPEMVNPNSNLYRKHPDWVYFYPERTRHEARNQLVLNICKPEVQQYLLESIVAIVNEVGVDYIKWDMNRPISEAGGSPELGKIVWINHVKSFHYLIEQVKLRSNHPIKIESCCSGGGRADLSILKRVQSCWPSDNTRPDARLLIQHGASLIMPPNMMSCWVTDSPNDDPHTIIPIPYRFHVSFMGALGIGSNLNKLNTDEFETYRRWIVLYKSIRHVLQKGNLDWLVIPTMNNVSCCITQTTTQMGDESVILAFRQTSPFWFPLRPIRLRRLIAIAMYDVRIWSDDPLIPVFTGIISGTALMNRGLSLPYLTSKAYSSVVVHIKQKL
ncbi:alpha-galactosidase [Cokeromyces recurvatus]|uniref:alpha-galactosidase n=1 Tax=Cokeromyces recurvatus TaxID=90255 RepID=UPI0022203F48|nr:alpha-galactosidase [Cokeromyces recurvatus]KAI7907382.1 alpha-galactosidase [Cokeromyces recurvatus]